MTPSLLTQGIGICLWVATLAIAVIGYRKDHQISRRYFWAAIALTLPVAFLFRGIYGDVSLLLPAVTSMLWGKPRLTFDGRFMLIGVIIVSVILNASALGFIATDIYAIGYYPGWWTFAFGAMAITAFLYLPILAWAWLGGIFLAALELHPSLNLWDALIDIPSIVISIRLLTAKAHATDYDAQKLTA